MADVNSPSSSTSSISTEEPIVLPVDRGHDHDEHDDLDDLKKELRRLRRECHRANAYNEDLRRQVDSLSQELAKAKANAAAAAVVTTSIAVQVTPEELEAYVAEGNWLVASQKANVSVADCVRAAAEEVTARIGYVYDEQSGYYYDSTSGYYYNAEQSLYYDAKTGIYFYYNADTKSYDFHSQIDVSQLKRSDKENDEEIPEDDKEREPAVVEVEGDVIEKKSPNGSPEDKKETNFKKRKSRKHKSKERDTKKERERRRSRSRRSEVDSKSRRRTKRLRLKENRPRTSDSEVDDDDRHRARSNGSSEDSSLEEGECSGSENSSERIGSEGCPDTVDKTVPEESACRWPPGIRIIVRDTVIDDLSVGTLFMVTCTGAIVGREKSADIQLVDMEVSKSHAEFSYLESECRYVLKDLGSQNGTFLNGARLSEPKLESATETVSHGDVVQFGSTTLLLHIHKGSDTCDDCEPGQIQAHVAAQNPEKKEIVILSKEEKERERKRALKQIKKRFGLEDVTYTEESVGGDNVNYTDRAKVRRKTKGSDNPYEKTEVASIDSAIPAKNKGFKMLEKMGWSSGQSLGKSQPGIVEPITVETKTSKVGLGFEGPMTSSTMRHKRDIAKRENWSKAQKRFERLQLAGGHEEEEEDEGRQED